MFGRSLPALLALLATACVAPQPPAPPASASVVQAAREVAAPAAEWTANCTDWDEWDKRAAPFRVHGDTYHVGTCGISALLVAGAEGHVLLDTGTRGGARVVLENIRLLGFRPENLAAVLTSHEHFDHVGGAWWVHQNSGAPILTSPQAEQVIKTGQDHPDDPQRGMHTPMRPVPAQYVSAITPGQPVTIAGLTFTPIATPGHTPGALSWQWESCEGTDCKTIVYADSLSPVSADGYRFSDRPNYVAAYRDGLSRLAALDCDILLTPHPSASRMRDKLVAGDLTAAPGCAEYAAAIEERLDRRLAEEAAQ
ncbi:MBL fold metallo-hydrolase [Aurantiacibacter aquimixticola]|uniref:MBL fold metallo-hydrolase n=1 Tax=Aurantiacibacter aquimixticola TaxID=1958945 RepID=A0A419RWP9_9SPHN|nr:MBL fold metallo-hydrolase [Aurantiacibacter aquimixticola]RJY10197.1 MBL fold metallo-hydrolase [Aurantiacibacter aquimixticola]